jgi:hypothetical protein
MANEKPTPRSPRPPLTPEEEEREHARMFRRKPPNSPHIFVLAERKDRWGTYLSCCSRRRPPISRRESPPPAVEQ